MPSALQLMNESPNCRTYTHSATDFRVFPNLLMMALSVGGNCDLLLIHRMTNVTPMNRLHYTQLHLLSWLLFHLLLAIKSKLQCCKLSQEWATGRISSKLCKKSRDFLTFKPPLHSWCTILWIYCSWLCWLIFGKSHYGARQRNLQPAVQYFSERSMNKQENMFTELHIQVATKGRGRRYTRAETEGWKQWSRGQPNALGSDSLLSHYA